LIIGNRAFSQSQIDFLNQIMSQLPQIIKSPVNYFELESLQTPDMAVYSKAGPKIFLLLNSDTNQILSRLEVLLSQFPNGTKNLYYIDMRFGANGYVCYAGTACAQKTVIPNTYSSTTPTNLSN
jgi:hypothetical protein